MNAKNEGYDAFHLNLTPFDNPYSTEPERSQWNDGWNESYDDYIYSKGRMYQSSPIDIIMRIIFIMIIVLCVVSIFL